MNVNAPSVSLELFERHSYASEIQFAGQEMLDLLVGLASGTLPDHMSRNDDLPVTVEEVATRACAAIAALLASPQFGLTQAALDLVCDKKQQIWQAFALSGFGSPAFLKNVLGSMNRDRQIAFNEAQVTTLLALSTLEYLEEFAFDAMRRLPPNVAASLLLGFLGQSTCLTRGAETNRQRLLRMGEVLGSAQLSDVAAGTLACRAWMTCSYSEAPDKHAIKRNINDAIRRWLGDKGLRPRAKAVVASDERRTCLLPLERFSSNHVMFRNYARLLDSLRRRFKVIALVDERNIDDRGREYFDEVVALTWPVDDPRAVVGQVIDRAPDVIVFPSIGMTQWTLWLSNLRLAPVQAMMGGHPATSASPEIDYLILPSIGDFDPACFSETVVVSDYEVPVRPLHDLAMVAPGQRQDDDMLVVGIPANRLKLTPCLLEACAEIEDRASCPIEFRFFPNASATETIALERRIRARLPGAVIDPRASYLDYAARLAGCDIALATFPFGATNSAIDALLLGVPWVCWDGPELHSGAEWPFLAQVGAPDWLRARDREGFVGAALRLLENGNERRELGARLRRNAVASFTPSEAEPNVEDFADTVDWLLRNHQRIQSEGRKVWRPEDRARLGTAIAVPASDAR